RDGEDWVLSIVHRDGTQVVRFATDTLDVTRVEERREGTAPLRVSFADYANGFAHALDLDAGNGMTASIAYDQVEPNVPIDAAAFARPPAPRVLPLERAGAAS